MIEFELYYLDTLRFGHIHKSIFDGDEIIYPLLQQRILTGRLIEAA